MASDPLQACNGFEWDDDNIQKNWDRHRVTPEEAEDVFFQEPFVVQSDTGHSRTEKRFYALGQTAQGRLLFVAFAIRSRLIRVISARDMNRRKRRFIGGENMKKLPKFKNEEAERKFWATADSTEFLDWSRASRVKPVNLKPSLKTISLRLPVSMIEDLKLLANKRDVPYQSLLKVFLADRLKKERRWA